MVDIVVCAPSYKRADNIRTKSYLPFINLYVAYEEYEKYIQYNKDTKIIQCEKGIQGNISRVRNYIIKKELQENNRDAVCIVDDDMKGVYFWEGGKANKVDTDNFILFLYKYTLLAKDLGVYLWGINVNQDKQVYRAYTPFSLTSYIGSPFMVFLKGNNCWFDDRLSLKEDYDMTLQQLNKNRKVLRINKYYYIVKQSEQAGGCASYRNYTEEERQFNLLQKKWGKNIVKIDKGKSRSHNIKKKKTRIDYNPIIKAPIKGI